MAKLKFKVGDIICVPAGGSRFDKEDAFILIQRINDCVTHYSYDGLDLLNGDSRYFHATSPMEEKAYVAA